MNTFGRPDLPLRFEQDLRAFLEDEARHDRPDYLADILVRSAATRQRPAWTIPERWLPMSAAASRVALPFRVPWRILAVAALLIVLLAAALFVAGSRPHLPSPFGLAANGRIAYAANGDIYTADPVTGTAKPIVTGSNSSDTQPVWSRDGTMLVFLRELSSGPSGARLMVAAADGSDPHAVTPVLPGIAVYSFSPDGRQIAFTSDDGTGAALWIADVQQGTARKLDLGMKVDSWVTASWLPPNGAEIVIVGFPTSGNPGLYAVDPASGTVVRTIVAPKSNVGMGASAVSPDGSRVAYSAWDVTVQDRNSYQVHVVNIDGSNDHLLPRPPGCHIPRCAHLVQRRDATGHGPRLQHL
jgi:hypothetical protein